MKSTILCAALWLSALVACNERPGVPIDGWHASIAAGIGAAEASGKPVLLVFR